MSLFKKLIYSRQLKDKNLYVYESLIYRWLCFDDIYIQTIINKYAPHRPILKYLPCLCLNLTKKKQNVVMLGAGGGAIYHYINHHYPQTELSLVEINKSIIQIAQNLFHVNHLIIQNDAYQHALKMPASDHVFIDLFINQTLPNLIKNLTFIKTCKKKTKQCVSINLLSESMDEINLIICLIRDIFDKKTLCLFVKKKSNIIIHAYKQDNFIEHINALTQNKIIRQPQWDPQKGLISTLY